MKNRIIQISSHGVSLTLGLDCLPVDETGIKTFIQTKMYLESSSVCVRVCVVSRFSSPPYGQCFARPQRELLLLQLTELHPTFPQRYIITHYSWS